MRQFGLIGKKLTHSFSKSYFEQKWEDEKIKDCCYQLFELDSIERVSELINADSEIQGLNVTIPFKSQIIPYLDELTQIA